MQLAIPCHCSHVHWNPVPGQGGASQVTRLLTCKHPPPHNIQCATQVSPEAPCLKPHKHAHVDTRELPGYGSRLSSATGKATRLAMCCGVLATNRLSFRHWKLFMCCARVLHHQTRRKPSCTGPCRSPACQTAHLAPDRHEFYTQAPGRIPVSTQSTAAYHAAVAVNRAPMSTETPRGLLVPMPTGTPRGLLASTTFIPSAAITPHLCEMSNRQ